jgi:N-acetylated-alpha-linked acidic dipeptidase
MGSGSDYTPFLQHLGIASVNLGYSGEEGGGCYHSVYDSFDHYVRFGDPDFEYGLAMVRTTGRVILRLADADVLPFEASDFADTIGKYAQELTKLANDLRTGTLETNRWIAEGLYLEVADPKAPVVEPAPKAPVPYLNFAPLQNALVSLQNSAKNFEESRRKETDQGHKMPSAANELALDRALMQLERTLVLPEGLPRRPWYRHAIYAPGFYTGYGVKTFPGIREAIEQRNWTEATDQIQIAGKIVGEFAAKLDSSVPLWR